MAVRRESVLLELDDHFTREMLDAARATKALDVALDDLDGSAVRTGRSIDRTAKETDGLTRSTTKSTKATKDYTLAMAIADEKAARLRKSLREQARAALDADESVTTLTRDTDRLVVATGRGEKSIDRFSGRMGILLKVIAALGPAIIPIGAVGVAGIAGLAAQLGFTAIAAGAAVAAFQGIGDALTAVNKAQLEPTVENLQAAHEALQRLSPAGRDLIAQLVEMKPLLTGLRDTAAEGLFPGLIEGFESLERLAPTIDRILGTVSETLGDLFAEGAESLASDRWADFFAMIEREAGPALTDMGHALGDVVHGLSELWEAFAPLNRDFGSWIADVADDFDKWATGLSETEGFQEFIAYIRENGPLVAEATAAIADAVIQIVQAAAPLGGPVLKAITGIADAIAAIADSPLGTPIMAGVTAISALSLASSAATAAVGRLNVAMATLGATSKKTAASTAAATGGAAAASGGGPVGLAAVATFLGIENVISNISDLFKGEMPVWEYGLRSILPGINTLETFGVKLPGLTDDVDEARDHITVAEADIGFGFQSILSYLEKTPEGLDLLGTSFEEVRSDGDRFSASLRRQAREMAQHERQVAKYERRVERMRATISAQAEAMQGVAESFTNFGREVKASEFTLDGYMDKLERQQRATERWRENAEKAVQNGLDLEFAEQLKSEGREGALQLEKYANATKDEIDRANSYWDRHSRTVSKSQQKIDETRLTLTSLGGFKAEPKVEVDNKQAMTATQAAKQALADVDNLHPNPKIDVTSNVASAAAATASALDRIADEEVYINVRRRMLSSLGTSNLAALGSSADGGEVPDDGGPYVDRIPWLVAPRERITSDRYGQATRSRRLLDLINAGRISDRDLVGRGRVLDHLMRGGSGGGVVRHLLEVRVMPGEMDLTRAVAQIDAKVRHITRGEIDQDRTFQEDLR